MRPTALALLFAVLACPGPKQATSDPSDSPDPQAEAAANPVTLTAADLSEISPATYPVEDGATITVVFTNFCEQPTEFGFTPDEGRPPIVWTIQPRQRQELTIPKGYSLRGRLAGTKTWTDASCLAQKKGHHLTFNIDCQTCTAGKDDPLERETCMAAGTCVAE